MATVVGAFGVPHMPTAPGQCEAEPDSLVGGPIAPYANYVDDIDPDVLVVFDTDHFHHWSYDRLPAFAVGVAARTDGPGTDDWPGEARFDEIPVDEQLARHLYVDGIADRFDLTLSEEFQVDHSITVPVHFLAATDGVVDSPDRARLDQRHRAAVPTRRALSRPRCDGGARRAHISGRVPCRPGREWRDLG